jgi:hypothetical protein
MGATLMNKPLKTQYLHSYWNNIIKNVDEASVWLEHDPYEDDRQTIEVALELDTEGLYI